MSSVRGAISNIRHYLNTIEREIAGYTTIDQRSKRRQPPAYRFKRKSFYKIHRHESSDEEEDSSDEDEDSSAEEEDSSDEETVSFDALAHELIEFYQRYGIDHYWTRYGAVGARGKGCRGGGDFCLFFNKNGVFVKAYEESKKKFVFDEYELDIRRQPFKDLFRL